MSPHMSEAGDLGTVTLPLMSAAPSYSVAAKAADSVSMASAFAMQVTTAQR
jgi:hypothetical protein